MSRARLRGVAELVLALVAALGAVATWAHVGVAVTVQPIIDGEPETTALRYDPQLIVLTLLLAGAAGVLVVLGAARLRRG